MTKSFVTSLLTFAVASSLALAQETPAPATGGWSHKPGGGLTYDGGDAYSLKLSGQLQAQFMFANLENRADLTNFDVRRARIALSGHAFNKNIKYLLRLDATDDGTGNNGAVKDAWVHWNFIANEESAIGLRFGQSKHGHGLEKTGSSTGLFFVERSLASDTLAANSRSRGAWVHGSHMGNKLRWNAGAQNSDVTSTGLILEEGEEGSNADNELDFVANVSFDPLGDMMGGRTNEGFMQGNLDSAAELRGTIGGGVFVGNGRNAFAIPPVAPTPDSVDVETTQFNINTAWTIPGGFAAQGEFFGRTDEVDVSGSSDVDTTGWYAQAGYTLPKTGDSAMQWGFGARLGMVDMDNVAETTEIAGVVNAFYHGHAAKTQFEVVWQDTDWDSAALADFTDFIFRLQFQLLF